MAKRIISKLTIFLLLNLSVCLMVMPSHASATKKQVLILNSYEQGSPWMDNVIHGMLSVLNNSGMDLEIHVEYMDTKRHPPNESFPYLENMYRQKYRQTAFDVILLSDNNALTFLLSRRDTLFPGVPIVFCGINNFSKELLGSQTGITGITEDIDIKGTIALASRILPNIQKVVVINDRTPTGQANRNKFEQVASNLPVSFELWDDITATDLQERLKGLPPDSAVLVFTFHRDKDGQWFSIPEYWTLIRESCRVPIFSLWDNDLGHGVLGGVMVYGREQGRLCAEYAIRILKGEPADSLPIMLDSPNLPVLDYRLLKKFNIPKANIPTEAVVLFETESLFYKYRNEIIASAVLFALLIVLVIGLSVNTLIRRRAERALIKSETLLGATQELAEVGGWEWDVEKDTMFWTDEVYRIHGFDPENIPPGSTEHVKRSLECYDPEDRPVIMAAFERCAKEGHEYDLEFPFTRQNGERLWIRTTARSIMSDGTIIKVIGTIMDITKQKQAVEALRESEKRLIEAQHIAKMGDFTWDVETDEVTWSDGLFDLLQYDKSEKIDYARVNEEIHHPDDLKRVTQWLNDCIASGTAELTPNEYRLIRKDGKILYVHTVGVIERKEEKSTKVFATLQDITERKMAEEALRQSERELSISNRIAGIFITIPYDKIYYEVLQIVLETLESPYGTFAYINENGDRVTPTLTRNIWVDCEVQDADILFLREEWSGIWGKCLTNKETVISSGPFRVPEGHVPITRAMAVPIIYQGEAIGNFMVANKTTGYGEEDKKLLEGIADKLAPILYARLQREINDNKRKLMDEALKESEAKFRAVFEHMAAASCLDEIVYDGGRAADYRILDVNPSYEKLIGRKKEEVIGSLASQVYGTGEAPFLDIYSKVAETGQPASFEAYFAPIDKYLQVTSSCPGKGKFSNVFSDITERKRTEEQRDKLRVQLSNAVEIAHLGHWEYDVVNDLFTFNDHFYKLFRTTAEHVGGYTMSSAEYARRFVHPDDLFVVGEETRKAIETTDPHFSRQLEHRMLYADGTVGHISVRFFVVKDAQGRTVKTYGVNQDITGRKRMEEELLRVQKLESVGLLAGGIAHDFNNILTTILGNVSMARMQAKPEDEIFELLSEAEAASTRAQTLTKQLLTFAKGGAPVKETALIKDILKESSSFVLRGSKSSCEFSIAEDLWLAEVDVGQIGQVINNIVINANQAMPKGGIIQVSAENLIIENRHGLPVNPGRYIKISIKDQGVGIAKEHLPNIFDPYFTTKQEGSGLGLSTTFSIIKKHDGHIIVESQLGVGTTFHIYLPASDKAVLDKEEVKLIKGQGRILVMDDEASLRKMVGRMLENLGYEAEAAKDGAEAIQMVKKAKETGKSYDAVILDLTIPGGMGGKEAIQELLRIDPEIKAIVSSGYSDDPVLANFQDYGFKGMMPKPSEFQSLSKVLHDVLKDEKE